MPADCEDFAVTTRPAAGNETMQNQLTQDKKNFGVNTQNFSADGSVDELDRLELYFSTRQDPSVDGSLKSTTRTGGRSLFGIGG